MNPRISRLDFGSATGRTGVSDGLQGMIGAAQSPGHKDKSERGVYFFPGF